MQKISQWDPNSSNTKPVNSRERRAENILQEYCKFCQRVAGSQKYRENLYQEFAR